MRVPARRREDLGETVSAPDRTAIGSTPFIELPLIHPPAFLRRPWLAIALTWLVCGLLWAQQSYLYLVLRNRLGNSSWAEVAYTDMVSAAIWAFLTPVVLVLAGRFPVRQPALALRILLYVVAGGATTFVHLFALQRLTLPETPLSSPIWQPNTIVGFLIFCAIAVIGHRRLFMQWLRAREAAAVALSSELAEAQARAVELQGIPQVLLHSLDGIAQTVRRDPALTERQLTRLADYLRLALEATDGRGMTPDREQALAAAVGALRESGAYTLDLTLTA